MPETHDQTRSIQDTLIIRKLLQEAIDYSNVAVYGAIVERRQPSIFQDVRADMEKALITLDEQAKLSFGDAYSPESSDKAPRPSEVHTVRGGKLATEFGNYGVTHDMDCPGCQDTPFTASPRSETYWSS